MVQTRNGQISVQVACNLRSVRQRLELRLPSGAHFDNNPLRLGNRIVPLEKGEEGQFFVPLVSLQQGENFLLELRYVLPEETKGFPIPVFPDDTAIQQVYLSVYLPQGRSLLVKSGTARRTGFLSASKIILGGIAQLGAPGTLSRRQSP